MFWYLREPSGQRLVARGASFLTRSWAIYLLALPIGLTEALLGTESDGVWNRFVWPFFIVYGILLASDRQFRLALERQRKSAIPLGVVAFLIYFMGVGYLTTVLEVDAWTDYSAVGLLTRFTKELGSWFWLVVFLGAAEHISQRGRRQDRVVAVNHGDPDHEALKTSRRPTWRDRLADYAKEAQLPFYMLHQTPIVIIGYYVVQWQGNALAKYVVIVLGTLLSTLLFYDIAIRRTWLTRFLLGLRPDKTTS